MLAMIRHLDHWATAAQLKHCTTSTDLTYNGPSTRWFFSGTRPQTRLRVRDHDSQMLNFTRNSRSQDPDLANNSRFGDEFPDLVTKAKTLMVYEQMSRSGGQSEATPPVFKSPTKPVTHLSTYCSRDKGLSLPCPVRE
ncbi:hypothetical protein TNCV_22351 [Trichonephila clavipes]|nr:hypothetical protein TNCV_22351 [Trichonephila clavipes]